MRLSYCLDNVVRKLDMRENERLNEMLLMIGRVKEPIDNVYQVKCNVPDCKFHVYFGPYQFCNNVYLREKNVLKNS